jgi:hypothetical protein
MRMIVRLYNSRTIRAGRFSYLSEGTVEATRVSIHWIPAFGTVEKPRRETFFVGRVPSAAKRNEKPDNSLSAFSPDLRSRSEADLQGFSTLPFAGMTRHASFTARRSEPLWFGLFVRTFGARQEHRAPDLRSCTATFGRSVETIRVSTYWVPAGVYPAPRCGAGMTLDSNIYRKEDT